MHSNSIVQTMTFDTDNERAMQCRTEVSINNLWNPSIVSRVGHGFRLTWRVSGSGSLGKGGRLLGSWTQRNLLPDLRVGRSLQVWIICLFSTILSLSSTVYRVRDRGEKLDLQFNSSWTESGLCDWFQGRWKGCSVSTTGILVSSNPTDRMQ
jgi:hypothetical protein